MMKVCQYMCHFVVNLITFSHGSTIGWLSPLTLKFQSKDDTPLNYPLTWSEISWIGSFTFFGAMIGTVVFYFILRYMSLRIAMLLLPFPTMVTYSIDYQTYFFKNIMLGILCNFNVGQDIIPFDCGTIVIWLYWRRTVFVFTSICGRVG